MPLPDERAIASQWDAISSEFARTRTEAWPEVVAFLDGRSPGTTILDLGCGHGRNAVAARERGLRVVGADVSPRMVRHAYARGIACLLSSATALPFRDASFESALSVAALHVIPGQARRSKSLAEVRRVLRQNGTALVTVWSNDLSKTKGATPWPGGELGDVAIPWAQEGNPVDRYYHLYGRKEFEVSLVGAGFEIEKLWSATVASRAPDNWFAIVRRSP